MINNSSKFERKKCSSNVRYIMNIGRILKILNLNMVILRLVKMWRWITKALFGPHEISSKEVKCIDVFATNDSRWIALKSGEIGSLRISARRCHTGREIHLRWFWNRRSMLFYVICFTYLHLVTVLKPLLNVLSTIFFLIFLHFIFIFLTLLFNLLHIFIFIFYTLYFNFIFLHFFFIFTQPIQSYFYFISYIFLFTFILFFFLFPLYLAFLSNMP